MHQIMLCWLTSERSCLPKEAAPLFKILSAFLPVRFLFLLNVIVNLIIVKQVTHNGRKMILTMPDPITQL